MSYGVTAKEFSDALVRLVSAPLCKHYDTGEEYEKQGQKPVRKSTKCQFCGAPLPISKTKNGICKCDWCRSENLVEGVHEEETLEITCLGDSTRRFIGHGY